MSSCHVTQVLVSAVALTEVTELDPTNPDLMNCRSENYLAESSTNNIWGFTCEPCLILGTYVYVTPETNYAGLVEVAVYGASEKTIFAK